jgi:hypothetical protein
LSELSIFIDESGDFGDNSDYYILSMLIHDQSHDISQQLANLSRHLKDIGIPEQKAIHTGPIIRREDAYLNLPIETRKAAFNRLFAFTRKVDIRFKCFSVKKREYPDRLKLKGAISRAVYQFLQRHMEYFLSFGQVIVYYDNGQAEVTDIINTLFSAFFFNVDIRRVVPAKYRLFQSADLLCTLELLHTKLANGDLKRSDLFFFRNKKLLRKDYLSKIEAFRIEP